MEMDKVAKFVASSKHNSEACTLIPKSALIEVIKNAGIEGGAIKAGKVVKDFFRALGASEISVSSMVVGGGVTRMAYKLKGNWRALEGWKMWRNGA